MHFLLTTIASQQMFQRLMSQSSGDTHCEERWTSMWFITGVLRKVVHIDTFGSTGSNNSIYIYITHHSHWIKCLKYVKSCALFLKFWLKSSNCRLFCHSQSTWNYNRMMSYGNMLVDLIDDQWRIHKPVVKCEVVSCGTEKCMLTVCHWVQCSTLDPVLLLEPVLLKVSMWTTLLKTPVINHMDVQHSSQWVPLMMATLDAETFVGK
jgi:hypothetical protein